MNDVKVSALGLRSPWRLEERRGRGGGGQIMTLPSLLTFISPCNVPGCLTLFCNYSVLLFNN